MLIIHFSSIENNLKQQNFFKQLFESVDNPEPENSEFWCNGIRFSVKTLFLNSHLIMLVKIKSENIVMASLIKLKIALCLY